MPTSRTSAAAGPVSDEAVEELTERYRRIGGRSPLDDVTEAQRAALETELELPVFVGMKHWRPRIAEAVDRAVAGGADTVVGIVLAPHYSKLSIEGYRERLEDALDGRAELRFVESWHTHEPYIAVLADRVRGTDAHVVFTAHSLPARILDEGDPYRDQLLETSQLVAERAGLDSWSFAFQSESPTGEPWLGPGHPRRARQPARARRRARARLPDRLRLRPSRDPLGPRRRGSRARGRARARVRPHRVAERRSRFRARAGGAVSGGRFSTLDLVNAGEIQLENVSRRFRVYPQRNMTLKEAIVRWRAPQAGGDLGAAGRLAARRAGHVDRLRRPQRIGQDDAPAADRGHLRADLGPPRGRRLGRIAARARRRLPSRLHRARERLPERLDLRAQAARGRRASSTRSSRSPSSSGSSTSPCGPTRRGC